MTAAPSPTPPPSSSSPSSSSSSVAGTATLAAPAPSPAATPAPARVVVHAFVRLKLALMRNGVRQSAGRSAAFVASVVLTVLLGGLGLLTMVALRDNEHTAEISVTLVAFLTLAWAFMPLFVSGIDETLDPGRLAMLPLRPRSLLAGQLAASLVGTGPLFTLLLVAGAAVAVARGTTAAVVAVLAVPLVLLVCTTLARALATANARLLTSRKGRDLAILSGVVVAFGIQGVNVAFSVLSGEDGIGPVEAVADVVRWLPPASAVDAVRAAGEGSHGVAALGLGGTAAGLALLLWWWQRALTQLLTAPDSSTLQSPAQGSGALARGGRRQALAGGLAGLLPQGRTGTVAQRTLRYGWRDPKAKMGWVTALGMGVLTPFIFAVQGAPSVYHACWAAGLLGLLMYNQFGQDYSAFWLVTQTISTPHDAGEELRGRALAVALIGVPYTALVVVLTAATLGGWGELPDALGLSLALLGALVGMGAVTSARFPYSIPQDNPMKNVVPGQGALAWFSIVGGMLGGTVLAGPVIGLVIWLRVADSGWVWTVLPLGAAYGLLLARLGIRYAARLTAARLPEILAAVSRT